jgi:histidine phosphotransfer protein HptB
MIDWERVGTLKQEIGEDAFEEVIALFLDEVDEVIERLAQRPDPSRHEQDLHFLKGSALNLGFADLSNLCQNGERLAASGQAHRVDLAEIIACYRASRTRFLDRLGSDLRLTG